MTGRPLAYSLYRSFWSGLDLLFPPLCGGCGKPGSRWCEACQRNVVRISDPFCEVCGIPVGEPGLCAECRQARPRFRALRSWSVFDAPVRHALHRLKYSRDLGLGDALAEQLSDFVAALKWPVDCIVPVPLGRKRMRERGYNQVAVIAHPLSLALKIDFVADALSRVRETRSQVGLSKLERHANVHAAFQSKPRRVIDRIVLLMDDVATTGSTLSSCAEALYASGARDVFALTVSRALTRHGLASA